MPFDFAPTETNTVADVLRRARALIEKPEHWCKHALERNGAFCVLGAALLAAHGNPLAAAPLPSKMFSFIWDACGGPPAAFNNAPERTHAEVLAAFDRAVALAESES